MFNRKQRFKPMFDVMARRGFFIDPPAPGQGGGSGTGNGQPGSTPPGVTPPGSQAPAPGNNQPPAGNWGPFKSADEVWKGYQEIQKSHTKTSQELKDIMDWRKKMESALGNKDENNFNSEEWLGEFATDPRAAIMKIINPTLQSQQVNQLREKVNQNLEKLRTKFKDFAELEGDMQTLVESGAFSSIDPVALETLYHGLKARKEFIKQAEDAAKNGDLPRVPGVDGPGGGSGGPGAGGFTEEQLRTMPFADLEKLAKAAK